MAVRQPLRAEFKPYFEATTYVFPSSGSLYARIGKRAFDVAASLILLLIFAPIILLLAFGVAMASGFPVFYGGTRIGKDGRLFRIWKLRTMVRDAESVIDYWREKGTLEGVIYFQSYKLERDPRITPFGSFLRRTSLDELPQLWNVLRGDMSLVGPRPIVEPELEKYGDDRDVLLSVRPGVTGLWQVSGRNAIDYPERAELELEYVDSFSWRQDALVLLRTIPVMVFKRNGR